MIKYPGPRSKPLFKESQKEEAQIKKVRRSFSSANRGMDFEDDINSSNEYYLEKKIALIYKRPTPINVVKVDYEHGMKITHAYFEKQSTTDYNGVFQGRYLDFEAKSTQSKTSIPLNNIAPQQVRHLQNVIEQKGIAFFLVRFASLNEVYLVDARIICDFYLNKPRKSIPYSVIKDNGYLVKEGYRPRYDFLPIIEEHFLK